MICSRFNNHFPKRLPGYAILFFLVNMMFNLSGCVAAPIQPDAPDQTVTLKNKQIYLSVNPKIGRVVAFGAIGRPSLIWLQESDALRQRKKKNRWPNYGGDKVWPYVEDQMQTIYDQAWPPDPAIDAHPWELIEQTPTKLTIQSALSPQLQVHVRRTFELLDQQAALKIHNTIVQHKASGHPVHVWSITQVKMPQQVNMHVMAVDDVQADASVWMKANRPPGAKTGAMGRWIEAIYPDVIFRQSHEVWENRPYAEKASVEYYMHHDGLYMELETLSPIQVLSENQTLHHTVTWTLLPANN